MRVEDIMNSPVVITQKTIKVSNLKGMLSRKEINAVPVIDTDGSISGIVSSSDIVNCHDDSMLLAEVMSSFIHVVAPNSRVKDAARTMIKHGVHHLVVMEDGKVIGMLSSMDIIKIYAELD